LNVKSKGDNHSLDIDGFKKYIHTGRSYIPKVTIRKNGVLAFNSGAVQKYDLYAYKYAILYISDDRNRIAVRFTNSEKESGILQIQSRPGNFQISARTFFGLYDIDWSENRNYDFLWNERDKTAILKVKDSKPEIIKQQRETLLAIKNK